MGWVNIYPPEDRGRKRKNQIFHQKGEGVKIELHENQNEEQAEQLQRHHAEVDKTIDKIVSCASCMKNIEDTYYKISERILCKLCCDKEKVNYNSSSRISRFSKALGLGFVAALIGAGIYYGVLALTGYKVGLIAILVGWLVGIGVNIGAEGRGEFVYQITDDELIQWGFSSKSFL